MRTTFTTDGLPTYSPPTLHRQIIAGDEGCRQWDVWAHAYAEGSHMAWGGWLAQNTAWWQAHERHPEQAQRTADVVYLRTMAAILTTSSMAARRTAC